MHFIDSIQFGLINPSLLKKEAACRIFEKRLYSGKKTCNGGLLDRRLGASSHGCCETCGGDTKTCPGHLGYIELSTPCFDLKHVKKIIRIIKASKKDTLPEARGLTAVLRTDLSIFLSI